MNREEVLAKSRAENKDQDERDKLVSAQAANYSALGMTLVFVLFSVIKISKGETCYDLLSIHFSYLTASQLFRYKLLGDKKELASALLWCCITAVWIVLYFVRG